jgi:hypothetical protein
LGLIDYVVALRLTASPPCSRSTTSTRRTSRGARLPAPERAPHGLGGLFKYVKAMADTMMEAHDRLSVEKANFARTIPIPTLGIWTTEFDITPARKEAL